MLSAYDKTYSRFVNQMILIDQKGEIIDNDCNIFESINGKQIDTIHPFFESLAPLIDREDKEYDFSCVNLNVEGKNHIVDLSFKTFEDDDNALITIHDLTSQYSKYQTVAQLRNNAKVQSEIFSYENELITKKEAFKDNFITNFSHEIRTPINTIGGTAEFLENSNLSQTQLYSLKVIKSTNEKLKYMVNDILDLSKIESGYLSIIENEINLMDELQTIADIYTKKCELKGLTLDCEIDENCPKYLISDKFRLAQVSGNLIGNAIKFTNTGTVTLKVRVVEKNTKMTTLEFLVSDTGIGIEKDKIDSIFDSFYQINNKQANKGAGLGLAIVKRIVEALNGEISVSSTTGKGSTFKIVFPFKISQNRTMETISIQQEKVKDYEHRVLIGETIKKDQVEISKTLNSAGKYYTVIVDNGDDIINQLHRSRFDIILLNLKLPTMDGFDVTRYIRFSELPHLNDIPIIALSGNPSEKEEAYCMKRRMNDYISKPYDKDVLLEKMKNILQKK